LIKGGAQPWAHGLGGFDNKIFGQEDAGPLMLASANLTGLRLFARSKTVE
jgi:hypothetical protein